MGMNPIPPSATRSVTALLFTVACLLPAVEVAVVNPSVKTPAFTADQIRDLLRGKRLAWDDGSKVIVVLSRDPSADAALMHFLDLNNQQFRIAWKKLVFTGKATLPEQVDSDELVADYVSRTPGAIGLMDKAKVKDGVRVVAIE